MAPLIHKWLYPYKCFFIFTKTHTLNIIDIHFSVKLSVWKQVVQGHSKAHGPYPRMIKGLFMHQPRSNMWAKTEERRCEDHSDLD